MVNFSKIFNEFKINLKKKKNFFCTSASLVKYKFFKILEINGYLTKCFWLYFGLNQILIICFKYIGANKKSIITGFKIYNNKKSFFFKRKNFFNFSNLGGLGIVSTSEDIMSLYKAKFFGIGGILIFYIW